MKFFRIVMRGGHNSHKRAPNELVFYIAAVSLNEAIKQAYKMPMVKHNSSSGIISSCEVSEAEYKQNYGHAYDNLQNAKFNRKFRNKESWKRDHNNWR